MEKYKFRVVIFVLSQKGKNPAAVDKLIERLIYAKDRDDLVAATKALDRVLLWNHYVIPQYYVSIDRLAYWDKFGRTAKKPRFGSDIFSWWIDPALDAPTLF
mgnify:CR=1 FL=1